MQGGNRALGSLGLTSSLPSLELSVYSAQFSVNYEMFQSACWGKHYSWPCVSAGTVISNTFRSFTNRHVLINTQMNIWGGSSADLWSHLLVQLPPFSYEFCLSRTPQTLSPISGTQELSWVSHCTISLICSLKSLSGL